MKLERDPQHVEYRIVLKPQEQTLIPLSGFRGFRGVKFLKRLVRKSSQALLFDRWVKVPSETTSKTLLLRGARRSRGGEKNADKVNQVSHYDLQGPRPAGPTPMKLEICP